MGYAIRQDGQGWVACERAEDCPDGYSFTQASPEQNPLLPLVKAAKLAELAKAYTDAIALAVTFTSAGGVTKSFQADPASVDNLAYMRSAFPTADALPAGFYWKSADNTKVPFTIADMAGLAKVMGDQGFAAFDHLDSKKTAVLAAANAEVVAAITW